MILFIANYPTSDTIKEGMSQRIFVIDKQFEEDERIYLFVSHRLFWKKEEINIEKNIKQYRCNLFLHFLFIMKLFLKAKMIYFHSVLNVFTVFPLLFMSKRAKRLVLDVHGIVPEEQFLHGYSFKSKLYNLAEKKIFKILDYAIVVTDQMRSFYQKKYPFSKDTVNYIIYPIVPDNLLTNKDNCVVYEGESYEKIEVIYSGNTQTWQNIPLMIELIKNNISNKVHYTILTGEIENMRNLFLENDINIDDEFITIKSVSPEELKIYYSKAHYGFILRDNIDINRVACPTKMMEYLYYGLIPIVKSEEIGDFKTFGYEYTEAKNYIIDNLMPDKSSHNHKIAKEIIEKVQTVSIRELLRV